jgi:hypothetical protein
MDEVENRTEEPSPTRRAPVTTWGYERSEITPVRGRPCQGYVCTLPAKFLIRFVADDRVLTEKLFCGGHAPTESQTYRGRCNAA